MLINIIVGEIMKIFENEGLKGFYRGLSAELLKVTPMITVTFFVYEIIIDFIY
jgi:hypothetical protein